METTSTETQRPEVDLGWRGWHLCDEVTDTRALCGYIGEGGDEVRFPPGTTVSEICPNCLQIAAAEFGVLVADLRIEDGLLVCDDRRMAGAN